MKDNVAKSRKRGKFVYRGRERTAADLVMKLLRTDEEDDAGALRSIERALNGGDPTKLWVIAWAGRLARHMMPKSKGGRRKLGEHIKRVQQEIKQAEQAELQGEFDKLRPKYQAAYFVLVVGEGKTRGDANRQLLIEAADQLGLQPVRQKIKGDKRWYSPIEPLKPHFAALYDALRKECEALAVARSPQVAVKHCTAKALATVKERLGIDMPEDKVRAHFATIAQRAARKRKAPVGSVPEPVAL